MGCIWGWLAKVETEKDLSVRESAQRKLNRMRERERGRPTANGNVLTGSFGVRAQTGYTGNGDDEGQEGSEKKEGEGAAEHCVFCLRTFVLEE